MTRYYTRSSDETVDIKISERTGTKKMLSYISDKLSLMQAYRSSIYDYSRIIYRLNSRRKGGMEIEFYVLNKKPTARRTFSLTLYSSYGGTKSSNSN